MRVDPYTGPAPQPPPYPARYGRNLLCAVVLAIVFGYAAQVVELRPLELLRDIGNIGVFLKGYLHPSFAHLRDYAWQCLVTVCIALWGTVLALAIAIPLGLLGARNLSPHPLLYHLARRCMDLFRAVNEFVFALMFVTAVGLGPFAGMLALGVHTGGVLGKLPVKPWKRLIQARSRASPQSAPRGSTSSALVSYRRFYPISCRLSCCVSSPISALPRSLAWSAVVALAFTSGIPSARSMTVRHPR